MPAPTDAQRAFFQSLRDQGAAQAYRNVADWLQSYPYPKVQQKITEKLTEITSRQLPPKKGDT